MTPRCVYEHGLRVDVDDGESIREKTRRLFDGFGEAGTYLELSILMSK